MITNGPPPGNARTAPLPKDSGGSPAAPVAGSVQSAADQHSQGNIAALSSARQAPAVREDFDPRMHDHDARCRRLAGLLPALRVTMPASQAEQQARHALESTLCVIDNMALSLVEKSTEVVKSGTSVHQFEMAAAIDRFLKKAEITMKDLVDEMVRELPPPPSTAMQKLAALLSAGMWRDIEKMQRTLETTFETPLSGVPGSAKPNAAQREQLARYYADLNSRNFQAQLGAVNLTAVRKPDFDARNLSGMAALRGELEAAAKLANAARSARMPHPDGSGAPTALSSVCPASGFSSGSAVADGAALEAEDENEVDMEDLEDQEEGPDADEPGLAQVDPIPPAPRRDR